MSELDRLEAATNECREMVREAHAATKDLRAAVREARQELRALARDEVAAQIQLEVSRQLEELGERTGETIPQRRRRSLPSSTGSVSRCWARRPTGKRPVAVGQSHAPIPRSSRPVPCPARKRADGHRRALVS
jgi:hypothetical protein